MIYCNTQIFLIVSVNNFNRFKKWVSIFSSGRIKQLLRRPLLKIDRSVSLFSDQSRASKSDTWIMCFLVAQYHTRSLKQVSFSLSRGSLPSILYLSLSFSISLFSRSLLIWRSPFSPDLEAVGLESNVAPGSRAGGHHRARQSGSCLASLSLHYDAKARRRRWRDGVK
jgi:hypothetical protein